MSGPRSKNYDLVVIGAGPAGIAAAAASARAGATTLLLDENAGPGGQVWRAITSTPLSDKALLGEDYWAGQAELQALTTSGAEILHRATVWSIDATLEIGVSHGGHSTMIKAKKIVIATGAMERPFPIPGWTLPGVMTAGAAQTMLKTSGLVPEGPVVLAGQGPLFWLLASQILRMGGKIDALLDTTPRGQLQSALPKAFSFMMTPYFFKGLKMMREVKRQTRIIKNVTKIEASGEGQLQKVMWETPSGREEMAARVLLLHHGVVPNVNLAMAAGVEHLWDELQVCWRPKLDRNGLSSVPGIYVAGDGAGIGGATVALARGRIAATAALIALGKPGLEGVLDAALAEETRTSKGRDFIDTVYKPAEQFRIPSGDTIVCRCEEITAKDILSAVEIGATGPNQLKTYLRTGMGPCQGRLCGLTVTELLARAHKTSPEKMGYYRLRAPVKPLTLSELAELPVDDAAVKAVVRE